MKDKKGKKKIGENGKPHASSLSSKEAVAANPTFLSGTGRGSAGCPTLKVRGKPPTGVTVGETEKGATKASIRGFDLTEVLRWLGANGFNWHHAAGMCRVLAIPARRNTLVSQVSAGANHTKGDTIRGPVPKIPPADASFIKSAVKRGDSSYEFDLK